jgi:hypothetical protein
VSLVSIFSVKEWVAIVALILVLVLAWLLLSGIRDGQKYGARGFSGSLLVSKAAFIREVLRWCVEHFGLPPRCRTWPRVDLRYYKHRKVMGTYQQRGKVITVYWGSHADLREVVNTVIHEYQHFLDIRSGKDDRAYDKEIKEVGYQDNSYERRARELADRWQKACIKDLEKRGLVG